MNIRDFEYFNALGDLLSFTQVANQFNVSQPTISYAIKRLEQYYGCDLIKREASHRSILLTNEGAILKVHIENILNEFITVERAIEHSKKNKIHIGFPPIIRSRIFSQLLNERGALSFIANFHLVSGGSNKLLAQLLSGRLDFSLIGSVTPLQHPDLSVKLIQQQEFFIFVSKDNPLAKKNEISFEETLDYPFILLEEGNTHMKAFQKLNEKYKKKAQILFYFSDVQTIGQLVKSNIGITLMTDFPYFQDIEGLIKIPLVPQDKEIFYIQYAFLKQAVLSDDLSKLINILDKIASNNQLKY
ncbi:MULTISPECIES: LysR family transcriptional regulator [unclassified Enterococcus]|uniref:LysR family transcriptional regulator n=1 Tax=unclassified Enterococcus TaxID=2608891 RepID=UPI001553ED8D|nr:MULTISPECIES: LysR family transcriptional regulator [unclassified Enterococcus]MBS7577959.1 LysR family transcriptional regulator [Enterococcus sp. MMGLQ5-2]MBS7585180.1 LysR family transcriptional regulator [Enterococcus sp. MMGLQ5-1]NPD13037.1 LysR family transcriptional regulator [Enterococcus sp. MMGLQ5-1]NPD37789.1 LysR family transcriptional regulator [Enterococcus sp. MMGLQ5-2]